MNKEERDGLMDRAVEEFSKSHDHSDVIERIEFFELLGVAWPTAQMSYEEATKLNFQFLGVFDVFRERLTTDRQMVLKALYDGGKYIVVPPAEQARLAYDAMVKKVKNEIGKGTLRSSNVNKSKLSEQERMGSDKHVDAVRRFGESMVQTRKTTWEELREWRENRKKQD